MKIGIPRQQIKTVDYCILSINLGNIIQYKTILAHAFYHVGASFIHDRRGTADIFLGLGWKLPA